MVIMDDVQTKIKIIIGDLVIQVQAQTAKIEELEKKLAELEAKDKKLKAV
jgi:polyhydroxyalkanoate synthesis regulator phasin